MKLVFAGLLVVVLIFIGIRVVSFLGEQHALAENLSDIQTRLTQEKEQEADLQQEMQYLANPVNLEKELRSQFNYKKPGETMVIIVPDTTSTAP